MERLVGLQGLLPELGDHLAGPQKIPPVGCGSALGFRQVCSYLLDR